MLATAPILARDLARHCVAAGPAVATLADTGRVDPCVLGLLADYADGCRARAAAAHGFRADAHADRAHAADLLALVLTRAA